MHRVGGRGCAPGLVDQAPDAVEVVELARNLQVEII